MKAIESLTDQELRAAAMFRALGNPARIRILRELAERRTCVTGELVSVLPLAQSTVSEHIQVLKRAGLVRGEVEGDSCYCLDPEALAWLARFCEEIAECSERPEAESPAKAGDEELA